MGGDYAKRKKLYANLEIPRGDVQRNQRMCPPTVRKKKGIRINKQLEKTRSNQVLQRRFRSRRLRQGLKLRFFPFGVVRPDSGKMTVAAVQLLLCCLLGRVTAVNNQRVPNHKR